MIHQTRLIVVRRAYEFGPDDLRLTMLSAQTIQERIKTAFGFAAAVVGTPMPTVGPVQQTIPPGVVFDVGAWEGPQGRIVPIRFLHIEPTRIVIDVSGTSDDVTSIYTQLQHILADVPSPDGSPIIGTSRREVDYSEITVRTSWSPRVLMPTPFYRVVDQALGPGDGRFAPIPSVRIRLQDLQVDYAGSQSGTPDILHLELRAGTPVSDQVYWSAAPLGSERHLAYLQALDEVLSQQGE